MEPTIRHPWNNGGCQSDLVVDPTPSRFLEGSSPPFPEQRAPRFYGKEAENSGSGGVGNFGLTAESTVFPVKSLLEPFVATSQVAGVQVSAHMPLLHFVKTLDDGFSDFFRLFLSAPAKPGKNEEPISASRIWGSRCRQRRGLFGRQDYGHGPTSPTGHHLRNRHVERDRRPDVPSVHLDADVRLV